MHRNLLERSAAVLFPKVPPLRLLRSYLCNLWISLRLNNYFIMWGIVNDILSNFCRPFQSRWWFYLVCLGLALTGSFRWDSLFYLLFIYLLDLFWVEWDFFKSQVNAISKHSSSDFLIETNNTRVFLGLNGHFLVVLVPESTLNSHWCAKAALFFASLSAILKYLIKAGSFP